MNHSLRSGWRGIGLPGVLFLAVCVAGQAQSTQAACNVTTSAVTIRAGGGAERVADVVVVCTGGFTTPPGQNVQGMTWSLIFNTAVTSRPLATGWSDALLVVNEPQAASQVACLTVNGICATTGSGSSQATYSSGRPNVFQGEFAGNVLTWRGVPFDPPGAAGTLVLRFTNLRVPAPAFGNVTVTVGASGQIPLVFNNATQILATSQTPISGSVSNAGSTGGRLSSFTVNVVERFGNVLKSHSAAGPGPSAQAAPGGVPHNFETGFYNPNLGTSPRGILSLAGLPDNGTRVLVALNGVPATATVSVPLTVNLGATGLARLVNADASGIGAYAPATSTVLPNSNGTVLATFEITQSSAAAVETLAIPFSIVWAAGAPFLQSLNGTVALAPLHASQVADTSPIPRFNNPISFIVNAPLEPLSFVTTSLPVGAAGTPYSQVIEVAGGLPPYSFVTTPLPPVPGMTLGTTGVLTGTPALAGTFGFSVTARDSAQSSITRQFSLTVAAAGSLLQTSVSKLDFSAILGGAAPGLQVVRVTSSQSSAAFAIIVDGGTPNAPAPAWLQGAPRTGTAPGLITVSVDPAGLPEGSYSARIRISIPGNPNVAPADVLVTLVVRAAPAVLESFAPLLRFAVRGPSAEKRQGSILLRNGGGGGALPFSASVLQRSGWITSIVPASGAAGAQGTQVKVNVDITGLAEGIYRDVIRFTSAINTVDVPVIVRIIPVGPVLGVSPAGVRFSMREGARTQAVREVRVFNRDTGSSAPWAAELIRGGEHFSVAGTNGTLSAATPGIVKVSVRPETAGLPAGAYYGLLRVTAPGAVASPAYVTLVLQVKPAGQGADLDLDAGGLVFTALTGGQVARRTITLNAASQPGLAFQAAASTLDGSGWLSVTPGSGTLSAAQGAGLTIGVDPGTLAAGLYRGEVTVATVDASQTITVRLILTDAASAPVDPKVRAAACSANRMAVGTTALANNFTVPAGWPATLTAEIRDNCGAAVSNATVVARFSNGDPPMTLEADDLTGVYTGTWQPGTPLEQANVTISALNADFPEARAVLIGSVRENKVPVLFRNGTIHNLDPKLGGLLAPGLVAQVYGSDMSGVAESTGSVPLVTNYKNTTVLVGPYEAPLYYVSPGQLVVQLPNELPPNRTYPILISANGALTIPDQIDVVAIQPGVAAFSDGKIIAQHSNFVLVDATNPAKRGEFLIMYLVGLGGTNQLVASGAPSPGTAPLPVLNLVPTVTMDGAPVEVVFAGLTPGGVGLYQINFKVPDNARLNAPLDVVVRQGPYTANVTTLTVVP